MILYGGFRGIILVGSGLFAYYVLSSLSAPPSVLGVTVSVGFVASAAGSILGGYLTGRFGKRHALVVSSFSSGFGWLALSLSRDWTHVALSYGLTSGMGACAFPALSALVSESVPGDVGGGLGAFNTATSVVSSIGAVLGATVAWNMGFESLFRLVSLPWFLSGCAILGIRERKLEETKKQRAEALSPFSVLRHNPNLIVLSFSVFLVTAGGYASSFYPDYLRKTFNVTPMEIGIFDSIYSVIWAVTNYPVGLLTDRVGRKSVIVLGYAFMGLAWILFPIPESMFWLFTLYAVYSLGNSMGFFTTALVMDVTPEENRGAAIGTFNFFMHMGVFLSGILGGLLWEYLGALASFMISFMTLIAATSLINFKIRSKTALASES